MSSREQNQHPSKDQSNSSADQRTDSRIGYKQRQRIAPVVDGQLPRLADFEPVRCHDISRGGASFFLEYVPAFTEIVVEISARDVTKHFRAKITNLRAEQIGNGRLIVGCRFLGPVTLEDEDATAPEVQEQQPASKSP